MSERAHNLQNNWRWLEILEVVPCGGATDSDKLEPRGADEQDSFHDTSEIQVTKAAKVQDSYTHEKCSAKPFFAPTMK